MRFDSLMTKNADVVPLLELLINGQEDGKELEILHLDSEVLHAT